ncbi:MAG: Rieske (2Fe-2S) protein [Phenylobacterium sp.]|nr:Rieske (2Fe-2S) protein [Phenylobacterium sp.]
MHKPIFTDAFFDSMDSSIVDVNEAEMLPPEIYVDPEFYEFEKDAIFAKEWLCVGRQGWIPNPGDYFTAKHMGEPLIIVRNRAGEIRAMSSVCQHRGMVVAEDSGNTRSFLCPYHHWAYNLEGELISAPAMEKACNFDKGEFSLPQLKVELWLGFIFINFDLEAAPLAPRLTAVEAALANYDLVSADGSSETENKTFPWNWKIMFENNNDGYHANRLHAGPMHDNVPSELSVFPELPENTAGYFRFNGTLHPDTSFNPTMKAVLPIFPKLTAEERHRYLFANVPPTLSLIIRSDLVAYIILHANTHDTITARRGWLAAPGASQEVLFKERLSMNLAASAEIAEQDIHVDSLIPVGLKSRFARRGRYSWQETAQSMFNKWLTKRYRDQWSAMKGNTGPRE